MPQDSQTVAQRARVLVVHDDSTERDELARLLAARFDVVVAESGGAVPAVGEHRPDLVLCAHRPPQLDGVALARALRSVVATRDVPVVLVSRQEHARLGPDDPSTPSSSTAAGRATAAAADAILIEPVSARELVTVVEASLAVAHARREAAERIADAERRAGSEVTRLEAERRQVEQALGAARRQLVASLVGARMVAWEWDMTTGRTERLGPTRAVLGIDSGSSGDFLGNIHPEDRPAVDQALRRAVTGEAPFDAEFRYIRPDNREIIWLHDTATLVREGGSSRLSGVTRDITARWRMEHAVRDSGRQLRIATDTAPVMLAHCDSAWRYKFVNRPYAETFGLTPQQVVGRRIADVLGAEAFERVRPHVEAVLRGEDVEYELDVPATDQSPARPVRVSYRAERDDAGNVVGFVAAIIDLAERKRAEQALRRSEEQLALVSNTVPALISYVDTECRYRFCNRAYTEWFGLSAEEIVGREMRDVLGDRAWRAIEPHIREAFAGRLADFEVEAEYARGGTRWIHATYTPHRDARGEVMGVVVMVSDITAGRRAEEALREADRRKDEFLAILAHELRNPLAPIRTGLELLRIDGERPGALESIRPMLERQVAHMVRLIDDLLDVSRITSGKIQLRRQPTAVGELVRNAIDANREAIEAAGLDLAVEIHDPACAIDVDPTRFVQVLSNLLHNATKFTGRGGRIVVRSELDAAAPQPTLQLTVRDSGIGIPAAMLPRVFDLFVQGDGAGGGKSGLGIGLALARQLVEMHGGRLEATSEGSGRGSAFMVRMPVSASAPVRDAPASREAPRRIARRVLIVDDNVDAAETLATLVVALGGEAQTAHDGESGVRSAAAFRPDVVLLDIGMPGIDGYETCRRLRAEPFGESMHVVALTGWGQEQDRERALRSGFDAHLTKPADPLVLADLLVRLPAVRRLKTQAARSVGS